MMQIGRQPEGVWGRTFQTKTLRTSLQRQVGLVWSRVQGGWGVEETVESVRSGSLHGCEKGFGYAKGTFHARMGMIKDKNSKDLEADEINKRWQ